MPYRKKVFREVKIKVERLCEERHTASRARNPMEEAAEDKDKRQNVYLAVRSLRPKSRTKLMIVKHCDFC